ncbi:hypothetical protein BpHYR1_036663 [Brachionus plicatilis]|uniref:Uncharacterized protein n=1 Tax=Brachionus plicatilis TaxID=10195 RepID=A0A3M7PCN6_BRAPC|nr:hypothetical protein BpHYR1_036663 [Brachionus plicatilis]
MCIRKIRSFASSYLLKNLVYISQNLNQRHFIFRHLCNSYWIHSFKKEIGSFWLNISKIQRFTYAISVRSDQKKIIIFSIGYIK